ncbi:putative LTR copia-type gag-polypeptide [Tanacetum coccineum]
MPQNDDTPPPNRIGVGSSASEASKLIFGDELYLHPTDASSTPLINLKLTGINNYNVWSHAMTLALNSKNKLGFIDGKCKKPTDKSVDLIPVVKTVFSVICREESHRGSSSATGNKRHVSAFSVRSINEINNKGHTGINKKNVKNPDLICSNPNCGLTGHTFINWQEIANSSLVLMNTNVTSRTCRLRKLWDCASGATQKETHSLLLYQIDNNIVEPSSTSKGNSYNIQNVVNETVSQRRSGRTSKLPTKLSDFVLDNKVKYGM